MALVERTPTTFRVEFGSGDWVELREKITVADRRNATNRAVPTSIGNAGLTGQFQVGLFKAALLYEMIVAWSDDEPPSEQAIDRLPEEMADRLLEELDRRNGGRAPEERAPLLDGSSPPLEGSAVLPLS